jgi:hypothetical protein
MDSQPRERRDVGSFQYVNLSSWPSAISPLTSSCSNKLFYYFRNQIVRTRTHLCSQSIKDSVKRAVTFSKRKGTLFQHAFKIIYTVNLKKFKMADNSDDLNTSLSRNEHSR